MGDTDEAWVTRRRSGEAFVEQSAAQIDAVIAEADLSRRSRRWRLSHPPTDRQKVTVRSSIRPAIPVLSYARA
jgi:hypothetical protein